MLLFHCLEQMEGGMSNDRRLDSLEEDVLDMLLAGNDPVLQALRDQRTHIMRKDRALTGSGWSTTYEMSQEAEPLPGRPYFVVGDVIAETIEDLAYGASFALFIRDGLMAALDG